MEPDELRALGRRILQARLDYGASRTKAMSQAAVAEALGVHEKTVGSWERGQKEPDLTTIRRLADLLHTSPEYLAFGTRKGGRPARPGRGSGEKEA